MELDTLKRIVNNQFVNQELVDAFNKTFEAFDINTSLRQAHFIAQVIHESGSFKYTLELASGKAYEGRKDLGNINEGDGVKFKGRGYIQITGRNNYEKLSQSLKVDFLNTPSLLEKLPFSMMSAGWYWDLHSLNAWADNDDLVTITKLINGGYNGLSDRTRWLSLCKEVLCA